MMQRLGFFSPPVVSPSSLVIMGAQVLSQCTGMAFLATLTVNEREILQAALESPALVLVPPPAEVGVDYSAMDQKAIQTEGLRFLQAIFQENEIALLVACLNSQTKWRMLAVLKDIVIDNASRERIAQIGYHPIGEAGVSSWLEAMPRLW